VAFSAENVVGEDFCQLVFLAFVVIVLEMKRCLNRSRFLNHRLVGFSVSGDELGEEPELLLILFFLLGCREFWRRWCLYLGLLWLWVLEALSFCYGIFCIGLHHIKLSPSSLC
jgi:hypothetical protein